MLFMACLVPSEPHRPNLLPLQNPRVLHQRAYQIPLIALYPTTSSMLVRRKYLWFCCTPLSGGESRRFDIDLFYCLGL